MTEVTHMEVIYVQNKTTMLINAVLLILVGILFIWDKNVALEWGFIIAGVCMIVAGVLPMIVAKNVDLMGVIMIVLGIILCIIPGFFADVTIIILGIIAILVGVIIIFSAIKGDESTKTMGVIVGALILIAGILIFLNYDIVFVIFGVILVVAGIVNAVTFARM